jgi:thiol-disulfide isomerase/thioredoxin
MKTIFHSVIWICLAIGISTQNSYGQSFLYSKYQDLEGNYVTIDEVKGETLTILDFWATWCKPCVKSIPENVKIASEYESAGLKFIGINEDSPRNLSKVRPFANSLNIDYQVILDPDQDLMTELSVSVLPTLIIFDKNGKVLYTHEGYITGDEDIIRQKIEELLSDVD